MMQIQTVLFILLALIMALVVVLFQYYYKNKRKGKLWLILSFLRFLAIFGIILLLVNPKFTKYEYTLEKTNLVILADNSSSITARDRAQVISSLSSIRNNTKGLSQSFNILNYSFGVDLTHSDSLGPVEKSTNISKALSRINEIFTGTKTAVVLFSDGNQTIGQDYEFYGKQQKFPIYPVVLGDTTRYDDITISQINANKYAFLKNKFPLEVFIAYEGKEEVSSELQVLVDGKLAYREMVALSNISNTKIISTHIEASTGGMKNIKVIIAPLPNEKNTVNNEKLLAVEVLDEKTNVAIISTIQHPDIGALKKSIESNEQRLVTIYRPDTDLIKLQEVDVYILYQPDASFNKVYEQINVRNSNSFTVLGTYTDLNFLNKIQNNFLIETTYPKQEIFASPNAVFSKFDISQFSLKDFPPLLSDAGPVNILGSGEPLLKVRIKGVDLDQPLLAVMEKKTEKHAILAGENIWKWRLQSYRNDQTFENFDGFLGKLIFYLSTSKGKNRLILDYSSTYNNSSETQIKATYFDEAFVFDANASINIKLRNTTTNTSIEVPMLLKDGYYEADLSNLSPGKYDFTVTLTKENLNRSGSFTILDFDAEKQFTSSNYDKLNRLAKNTDGKLYFPDQLDSLAMALQNDPKFIPVQKSKQIVVPLIDFKFLLGIIIAALSLEWFIRKFNGLT
ncbi:MULTISPECIES: VWA domain-containing protein [unclassified Arenibacter]|uniref:VWA domain-containing protein n=1 Tax=unclassified Arenibacter TaxID=2615047 RepID=UPI0020444B14|nr:MULTISPECIES: VWA domain-containing protein [unclassified Arenibacter]